MVDCCAVRKELLKLEICEEMKDMTDPCTLISPASVLVILTKETPFNSTLLPPVMTASPPTLPKFIFAMTESEIDTSEPLAYMNAVEDVPSDISA
jgi:hypothetical protein